VAKFRDIPQFTRNASYRVNVDFDHIPLLITRYSNLGCDFDPDFQRAHVWTTKQQIAYLEFRFRGGMSGQEILFNHPNWLGTYEGQMVMVDGKQRLEAVRRFLENEIQIFGNFYCDFTDHLPSVGFVVAVNMLKTRREVLQWYIDLNAGGTPHSEKEIERVRALVEKEPPINVPVNKIDKK